MWDAAGGRGGEGGREVAVGGIIAILILIDGMHNSVFGLWKVQDSFLNTY